MMLSDLRVVLSNCSECSNPEHFKAAVVDENILGKPTVKSARMSFDRLRELYSFDSEDRIFHALTDTWAANYDAQPLLALLCATARDPILRAITPFLLGHPVGVAIAPKEIAHEAEQQFPGKFRGKSLQRLGRNASSTWAQAGLLEGRHSKVRSRVGIQPVALAFALLLGDLCGKRGRFLFDTIWVRMLDASPHELRIHAVQASREGWIDFRSSGDVVEVAFSHLMREG
jgi:hypothetical protein